MDIKINENDISNKDILERLYSLRDFEIKHLWQRSIFLATFITLLFTGYFGLFNKLFNTEQKIKVIQNNNSNYEIIYEENCIKTNCDKIYTNDDILNFACVGVALFGIIFSLFWIFMAKGSKAWYEIYENKINVFEKTLIPEGFKNYDNLIYTQKGFLSAGAFSVSKINILIGYILALIWSLIFAGHLCLYFFQKYNESFDYIIILIIMMIVGLVLVFLHSLFYLLVKSDSLKKK